MRSLLATALAAIALVARPHATGAQVNVPAKANKQQAMFVQSYLECAAPTLTHNPPLAFPACVPTTGAGPLPATFALHHSAGGVTVPGGTANFYLDETLSSAPVATTQLTHVPRFGTAALPTFVGTPLGAPLTLPAGLCASVSLSANQAMAACTDIQVDVVHVHGDGSTTAVGTATVTGRTISQGSKNGTVGFGPNPIDVPVTGDTSIPAGESLAVTFTVGNQCSSNRTVWQAFDTPAADPGLVLTSCASVPVSFGPKSLCLLTSIVKVNPAKQATDVAMTAKCTDLRGLGGLFSGTLTARSLLRMTDQSCPGAAPCTMIDIPFPVQMACGVSAVPPLTPGRCLAITSMNAVLPGTIVPGARANVEFGPWEIFHNADPFVRRGLYLP